MKKVALVFALAVLLPSLVLAWLAVRSLRDQQFLLERQQALLCQRMTDALAQRLSDHLARQQQTFAAHVEDLLAGKDPRAAAVHFDDELRRRWPLAQLGFCVTLPGILLSPLPNAGVEARTFFLENGDFLGNRVPVEVYNNGPRWKDWLDGADNQASASNSSRSQLPGQIYGAAQFRNVIPQSGLGRNRLQAAAAEPPINNLSKAVPAEAEFGQLVGSGTDGMLARFLQNKLQLMFWHRASADHNLIFGAQLSLARLVDALRGLVSDGWAIGDETCLAVLDDNAKPVALSHPGFQAAWKRPFAATEIGEALPHWEAAAYLINPAQLAQAARTATLTLGLLIALLLLAIGAGSWLIVRGLNSELKLARQKTDFVGNVSHELKTPLTSIRMFSELLAEGRVTDPAKLRSYLDIITAEASRLTRLINNVLDFSSLEGGKKKYRFQACDLAEVVRGAAESFRPHLEANGFNFQCVLPDLPVPVSGDADALSQIIVNLLSNAEKYSNGAKEIVLQLARRESPVPYGEVRVLDRGPGVPRGSEEKVFEKFYRAHDSLSSGVQGSGLGLTIARQIARAHGGDVVYEPRVGGGSCFVLRLPCNGLTRVPDPSGSPNLCHKP
jgi:signal transduction histidine kinase